MPRSRDIGRGIGSIPVEGGGMLTCALSCASWDAGALGVALSWGCFVSLRLVCYFPLLLSRVVLVSAFESGRCGLLAGVSARDDGIPWMGYAGYGIKNFTCMMYLYGGVTLI